MSAAGLIGGLPGSPTFLSSILAWRMGARTPISPIVRSLTLLGARAGIGAAARLCAPRRAGRDARRGRLAAHRLAVLGTASPGAARAPADHADDAGHHHLRGPGDGGGRGIDRGRHDRRPPVRAPAARQCCLGAPARPDLPARAQRRVPRHQPVFRPHRHRKAARQLHCCVLRASSSAPSATTSWATRW